MLSRKVGFASGWTALAVLGALPLVHADTVLFSSRPGNNTSFGSALDYLDHWNSLLATYPTAPAGYGDAPISVWDYPVQGNVDNHELIPSGSLNDIAYHYHVDFAASGNQTWDFRIAPDFGFGGAVFLDGAPIAYNPNDMWWDLDWNNTSQLFTFSSVLSQGGHTLDVYGQEGCCDGPTAGEYRIDGGPWTPFASVPEPSALLSAFGILSVGVLAIRRRRK